MKIEVVDSIEHLEAIAREWDEVLEASRANTVFLTSDWLISWWKGYQPQGRLMCLAVRNKTGHALGFAPFYVQERKKIGLRYRALLFLGDGTHESEYLDIFCRKDSENIVFPLVLDWLSANHDQWDVCEWNVIPQNSPSLPYIKDWAINHNGFFTDKAYECSRVQLPDDYEDYLDSLNKKHRKNVKYYCSRAIRKGNAEYLAFDDREILPQGLDILYDLHKKRWDSIGLKGAFVDSRRKKFYQEMTSRFSDKRWLRLRQLNLYGKPAAVQIGFVYGGIYSALQEGFEPELSRECPGVVLRAMHIQELIQENVKVYDFLGYPTHSKQRWNAGIYFCCCVVTSRQTPKAQIVVRIPRYFGRLKQSLLLPKRGILGE